MEVGLNLFLGGEPLDRATLESGALVRNFLQNRRRKNKKTAIDPTAFSFRFLMKARDFRTVETEASETGRRMHSGDGGLLSVTLVEGNGGGDVDIAHAVSVGHAEGFFVLEVAGYVSQAPARARIFTGIDQGHAPGFGDALMDLHSVFVHVEGHVRHVQEIVGEVFLDEVALVAAADNEVVDLVLGIDFEDVPKDRPAPDFNHRLGAKGGLFA